MMFFPPKQPPHRAKLISHKRAQGLIQVYFEIAAHPPIPFVKQPKSEVSKPVK